jgi:HAE1 family hydrophobic/amphiphilic exporter-1/multidrug efflux pump
MLSATVLAIFFVPVFFTVVKRLFRQHHGPSGHSQDDAALRPQES